MSSSGLILREFPNVKSKKLTIIPNEEILLIKDTTLNLESNNSKQGKWNKTRFRSFSGWVFDPFLYDFSEETSDLNFIKTKINRRYLQEKPTFYSKTIKINETNKFSVIENTAFISHDHSSKNNWIKVMTPSDKIIGFLHEAYVKSPPDIDPSRLKSFIYSDLGSGYRRKYNIDTKYITPEIFKELQVFNPKTRYFCAPVYESELYGDYEINEQEIGINYKEGLDIFDPEYINKVKNNFSYFKSRSEKYLIVSPIGILHEYPKICKEYSKLYDYYGRTYIKFLETKDLNLLREKSEFFNPLATIPDFENRLNKLKNSKWHRLTFYENWAIFMFNKFILNSDFHNIYSYWEIFLLENGITEETNAIN